MPRDSPIHSQWQHTHCQPHFLGSYPKLSRWKGPRLKPHRSFPIEVTPADPSPDQEACHKQCPDLASWLNHLQKLLFTLPVLGQPSAGEPLLLCSVPGGPLVQACGETLGVPSKQANSSALRASAFPHQEQRLRNLTATHFAAFWG